MPCYNRVPKRDHNFDNYPCEGHDKFLSLHQRSKHGMTSSLPIHEISWDCRLSRRVERCARSPGTVSHEVERCTVSIKDNNSWLCSLMSAYPVSPSKACPVKSLNGLVQGSSGPNMEYDYYCSYEYYCS